MKKYFLILYIYLFNFIYIECKVIDEIVAIVNDSIILKSEVDNLKKLILLNNNNKKDKIEKNNNLFKVLLDELIVDKMSYKIALNNSININESDIDNFIDKIAIQNSTNKKDFLNKIINNNININYYRDFIKRKIANNILYNKKIKGSIKISNKELENLNKSLDSNKILDLFIYYDINKICIPFNKNSKNNIVINNKTLIDNIHYMLKNNLPINKINIFIKKYNKNIKIFNIKNVTLKDLDEEYVPYFNKITNNSIIGPINVKNDIHFIKVNNILKPNFSKNVNEVIISNVFIKNNLNKDLNNSKEIIFNIYENIKNNKITFNEACKKYSNNINDYNNSEKWVLIDVYNDSFKNEIEKLKIDEISKPFISNEGWNIIKLVNKRELKYSEFIKNKYLFNYLFNKKFYESLDEWIKENKKNTYIKIFNN